LEEATAPRKRKEAKRDNDSHPQGHHKSITAFSSVCTRVAPFTKGCRVKLELNLSLFCLQLLAQFFVARLPCRNEQEGGHSDGQASGGASGERGHLEELFEKEEERREESEGAAEDHPGKKLRSRGCSQSR